LFYLLKQITLQRKVVLLMRIHCHPFFQDFLGTLRCNTNQQGEPSMPETPEATNPPSPQEVLAGIQSDLRGEAAQTRLDAIQTLAGQKFSSPAILRTLEELALKDRSKAVREAARQTLASPAHRYVQSRLTRLNRKERRAILAEIADWEEQGMIETDQASLMRQRYDFDLTPDQAIQIAPPLPPLPEPAPVKPESSPPQPSTPRPGLAQTLLSETSIKIALYLGAFFVIAAAAILAAVLEAARLPILLAATALFAGGAVLTRGRLPQPSFALFIVFSFLLPTDANVLADVLDLSSRANAGYWFIALALMALLWSFGAWFYSSRLFSLAAFISLVVSLIRLGELFEAELEIHLILLSLSALLGLGGAYLLKRWQSARFSLPLFILVQIFQLGLVAFALVVIAVRLEDFPSGWNFFSTSFWLLTMLFYVCSDLVFPLAIFPWLSMAALYPLPINFMLNFSTEPLQIASAAWIWGLLLASASELFRRLSVDIIQRYAFPALTVSLISILTAVLTGYIEEMTYGFVFMLASAVLYALLHISKPRSYLWATALLLGLGAYFSFFSLPFMEHIYVFIGYQVLGASLLLLVPDLFLPPDFSHGESWRWPLRILGALLAFINFATVLPLATQDTGHAAIAYGFYAIFFAAYALRYNRAWLGFLATASAALAMTFAFQHFELDLWLPVLTALAGIYYLTGLVVGRNEGKTTWSNMLRYSGLGLASLVSIWALFTLERGGGWYVLVTALLFALEMFAHKAGLAEAGLQFFFAAGVFLILWEANLARGYQVLGIALALLGTDLALAHFYAGKRPLAWFSRGFGALVVLLNTFDVLFGNPGSQVAATCFFIYMLFFLVQALLYRQPLLGYSFSLFSVLTVIFTLQAFNQPRWMHPVTLLAVIYYAAGFFLRKTRPEAVGSNAEDAAASSNMFTWPFILWTSGLGAGLLATIVSPMQGGLSAAIPAAVTATMVAIEAFERRNVWLGFPANALYLMSYFILLLELNVDEPQFFSIATAALGMLMHYLLTRAGSRTGAFITGMVSQLVLLSTTYIQFLSSERMVFFFAIFFQGLAVLGYGIIIRSRSLVITPLAFLVLSVLTVAYGLLQGILTVVLIGCTGMLLLMLGILAVLMRDRFKQLGERFSDWGA
jgi:hypothetical protein